VNKAQRAINSQILVALTGLCLIASGCGHTTTAPKIIDPLGDLLSACGQVLIDGAPGDFTQAAQTKQTAIRDSSGITLDAGCSVGNSLTYSVSWGDGAAAPSQSNSYFSTDHVYAANGSYTVTLTVRDRAGRSALWTGIVRVIDFGGRWANTTFNAVTNRNETRYLDLTQGSNKAITGVYTAPEGSSTSLVGAINGLRGLNIHSTGNALVVYADDSGAEELNSDGTKIRLEIVSGPSVLMLTFAR
jgi:hypothetical protein